MVRSQPNKTHDSSTTIPPKRQNTSSKRVLVRFYPHLTVGWSKHINYNGDLTGYTYIYIYVYIYICMCILYIYMYNVCSPSPAFFLAPFPFLEGTCVLAKSTLCTATSSSFSRLNCLPVATCYFHNPGCFFISHWSVHWYHHEELGKLNIFGKRNTTGYTANNMIFECLRIGYMVYPILWSLE
jgi:hypothetical protein